MKNNNISSSVCAHIFDIYDIFENDKETEIFIRCSLCGKEEKWIINKNFITTEELIDYMNNKIATNKRAYIISPIFKMEHDLSMNLRRKEWKI